MKRRRRFTTHDRRASRELIELCPLPSNEHPSGGVGEPPATSCSQTGAALILALLVVFLTTSALLLGTSLLTASWRAARAEVVGVQLRALLDAGVALTLAELCRDRATPGFSARSLASVDPSATRSGAAPGTVEAEITLVSVKRASVVVRATLAGRTRQALLSIALDGDQPAVTDYWEGADDTAPDPRQGLFP